MPGTDPAVRAEALFLSSLQPSGSPSADQIRRTVTTTLRRLGARGCAARVAGEFGDHPDTAAARMSWALATISTVYPIAGDLHNEDFFETRLDLPLEYELAQGAG